MLCTKELLEAGMPSPIDFQVLPKSEVLKIYGLKSPNC